jgi:hypothetical protein
MVDFALKELIVNVQRKGLCNQQEVVFFKQYCDLLLYSIEAMRIKYMYDHEDKMKIDLTDSGFPNYLEFRYLYNDLGLRNEYLNKLTSPELLKEEFLDTLLKKKQPVKNNRLFQAASIVYYTSVQQQYIFNRFVQGKIIRTSHTSNRELLTSWSFYDVTHNRPFVCFMYFDYDGHRVEEYKKKIYDVLEATSDRDMSMATMAYAIDKNLPRVFPKYIKRIDLGPLHNVFAKDANDITHALLESITRKEVPLESYVISMKIEEVYSASQFYKGGFFNKQALQNWSEPIKQKYVFAPHRIIQMLYNKTPEIIDTLAKPPIQISNLKIEKV